MGVYGKGSVFSFWAEVNRRFCWVRRPVIDAGAAAQVEADVQQYLRCLRKMDVENIEFLTELSHVEACRKRQNYDSFIFNMRDFLAAH